MNTGLGMALTFMSYITKRMVNPGLKRFELEQKDHWSG